MLAARFRCSGAPLRWALLLIAVIGVVGVGVGGCGGSDSSGVTPTARVPRSTTTRGLVAPPTTAAPGEEDFTAILRDLLARRDEAYEKNDVTILEAVYAQQCECLARERAVIERRLAEGVHTEGARQTVHSVDVIDRPSRSFVVVRAVTEQGPNQLVREDGSVVRPGETQPATAYVVALTKDEREWVVASFQVDPATGGAP